MVHIVRYCGLHGVGIGAVCLVVIVRKYFIAIILTSAVANALPRSVCIGDVWTAVTQKSMVAHYLPHHDANKKLMIEFWIQDCLTLLEVGSESACMG